VLHLVAEQGPAEHVAHRSLLHNMKVKGPGRERLQVG
jgi:hypothetical protein